VIRLFVAIPIPHKQRQRLKSLCNGVREARWTNEENFHLTLRFIGEVEEPEIDNVSAALSMVRSEPFEMTLSGVGHFESRKRVRSLWAGVMPCLPLTVLQERIESVLSRNGLPPDGRKFSPHITLGRMKQGSPEYVRDWLEGNGVFRAPPFVVESFTLFESYRAQTSAIYTPLNEIPLVPQKVNEEIL